MRARRQRWWFAAGISPRRWAAACLAVSAHAASYHFGAVWDGAKLWKDACVAVEGERVVSVGPCSGPSVDLTRYTAIPGMIDVHTHMTYVLGNRVSRAGRTA